MKRIGALSCVSLFLSTAVAAVAIASVLVCASSALADGPCGKAYTEDTACGITSPATVDGNMVSTDPTSSDQQQVSDEGAFFAFWAAAGTQITAALQDTGGTTCLTYPSYEGRCAYEELTLEGPDRAQADGNLTDACCSGLQATSQGPSIGPTTDPPTTLSYRLPIAGLYYLAVTGQMALDSNENPFPTPFSLTLTANPRVQWPPPNPESYKPAICEGSYEALSTHQFNLKGRSAASWNALNDPTTITHFQRPLWLRALRASGADDSSGLNPVNSCNFAMTQILGSSHFNDESGKWSFTDQAGPWPVRVEQKRHDVTVSQYVAHPNQPSMPPGFWYVFSFQWNLKKVRGIPTIVIK